MLLSPGTSHEDLHECDGVGNLQAALVAVFTRGIPTYQNPIHTTAWGIYHDDIIIQPDGSLTQMLLIIDNSAISGILLEGQILVNAPHFLTYFSSLPL